MVVAAIRVYQVALGGALGGRCRFYPSCSAYAVEAVKECGAIRGLLLAAWRVLRCSPLADGGVDHPPRGRAGQYDADIPVNDTSSPVPGRAA